MYGRGIDSYEYKLDVARASSQFPSSPIGMNRVLIGNTQNVPVDFFKPRTYILCGGSFDSNSTNKMSRNLMRDTAYVLKKTQNEHVLVCILNYKYTQNSNFLTGSGSF